LRSTRRAKGHRRIRRPEGCFHAAEPKTAPPAALTGDGHTEEGAGRAVAEERRPSSRAIALAGLLPAHDAGVTVRGAVNEFRMRRRLFPRGDFTRKAPPQGSADGRSLLRARRLRPAVPRTSARGIGAGERPLALTWAMLGSAPPRGSVAGARRESCSSAPGQGACSSSSWTASAPGNPALALPGVGKTSKAANFRG